MQDSAGPFSSSLDGHEAIVPLRKGFRFLHEPVRPEGSEAAFVGRDQDLEELAARLLFSNGGAFLVTGYRGVGKTSFVNQVIRKLSDSMPWASEQFGAAAHHRDFDQHSAQDRSGRTDAPPGAAAV